MVISVYETSRLLEILVVCFEIFIVYYFLKNWLQPKSRNNRQIGSAYLAFGALTGFFSIFYPHMIVLPIAAFIGIVCVSLFLYKGHFLSHVFGAFVLLLIGVASEALVAVVLSEITQLYLYELRAGSLDRAVGMVASKMLSLLIVGVVVYYFGKNKAAKSHKMWRTIPLLLCQLILIAILISIFINAYQRYGVLSGFDMAKIIGILIVSIFIFAYYDLMAAAYELKHINQMSNIQLDNLIKHYSYIQEQEKTLTSIRHDIGKFAVVLDDMINTGRLSEALKYKKRLRNI